MIMSKEEADAWHEILKAQVFLHKHFKHHKSAYASDIANALQIPYERARAITDFLVKYKFLSTVKKTVRKKLRKRTLR
ncbi:MAG: hypothetical protein UT24_C0003G0029 [Candidatus Woesebacteria bacterium GW2011_GWB1_39_12]|uniref:Uncharacterized protein n=2 Tax=Patescibacteria group TaxID=1783273 RepID=A0A0G1UWA9_9BACT|nr:MAG: hypothetical protein UT24_C0003G0029 [Candidatus Woesebacteria bacterium GW2011_GWB1_39_12]KKU98346.1 MAG: hypothetical protein UY32_C0028G0005 [Candidatus Jorgensenbacteria bacterium GW2011_GWC1_48_8]